MFKNELIPLWTLTLFFLCFVVWEMTDLFSHYVADPFCTWRTISAQSAKITYDACLAVAMVTACVFYSLYMAKYGIQYQASIRQYRKYRWHRQYRQYRKYRQHRQYRQYRDSSSTPEP